MSFDTCVVCYENINDGWYCNQCRDGKMCLECLEQILVETCPVCRTGMNKEQDEKTVVCFVDRSHGVATHYCEKCNLSLCLDCDLETHMYALMRFHIRVEL